MKHRNLIIVACLCWMGNAIAQEIKTDIKFMAPGIVRVVKYDAALKQCPQPKSYSVIMSPEKVAVTAEGNKQSSDLLTVQVDGNRVTFLDKQGNTLLAEGMQAELKAIADGVDKGSYSIRQDWALEKDEQVFGLGQRREKAMSQRGERVELWNTNTHTFIPYFTSEKGWGLYWDNAGRTIFDDKGETTVMSSTVADCMVYYFMYTDGSQDGVMQCIRKLSGQATMFPLWTMGFWQCRERYKTPDELASVLDEYRRLGVPLDGIVQDWQYWGCDSNWNAMKFENPHYLNKIGDAAQMRYLPNDEDPAAEIAKQEKQGAPRLKTPQEMIDYVHANNAHLMISIWPDFGPWTAQYRDLKKMNGLLPFDTWPRDRGVLVYDAYNPKARDIYWKYLTNLYKMGFDAWWTDSTEPDHFEKDGDYSFLTHDGSWERVKNAFPLVTNRGIYEHQRKMKGNTKRSFQMTRSGAFGEQHYGTLSWSGDISSNWSEFKNQIPSGLNFTLCGIPMWNTDLGGFFCWDYNNNPRDPWAQEINVRWMQWGVFMPLMRSHCSSPMVSEIYKFGKKGDWAYDAMKQAIELRYRLLPYTYSQLGACVQQSDVMMRALVMDFPKDKRAIKLNDTYMFGRSLLVHPITDPMYSWQEGRTGHAMYPDPRQASVPYETYLPAGTRWYNFWTNKQYEGGKRVKEGYSIERIPVFVRAGSIIPFGPQVQYTGEKPWDNLEVRIYRGADADYTLYEDAGDGYEYEKGEFTQIRMHWDEATSTLTIKAREGRYPGMLQTRKFNVVLVDGSTPAGNVAATGKSVSYNGNECSVAF